MPHWVIFSVSINGRKPEWPLGVKYEIIMFGIQIIAKKCDLLYKYVHYVQFLPKHNVGKVIGKSANSKK